ncbi:MAG: AraC family transcriptional regulator, partial [Clostridiales bacterium]|nr:AraC family transcriptional regulator [Clostridiales bacterium]
MDNNVQVLRFVIEYIEEHIREQISLDEVSKAAGYSKYHLHRMFTVVIGMTMHQYIKRRQLTEAAKSLIFSKETIIQIALDSGYDSQQAFLLAFKEMYRLTPQKFRRMHQYHPIQLKFEMSGNLTNLKGDRIMDIKIVEREELNFVGYKVNTGKGFFAIPRVWHMLNKEKSRISNRTDMDFIVGINDYSKDTNCEKAHPAFDYYAAVEVDKIENI